MVVTSNRIGFKVVYIVECEVLILHEYVRDSLGVHDGLELEWSYTEPAWSKVAMLIVQASNTNLG